LQEECYSNGGRQGNWGLWSKMFAPTFQSNVQCLLYEFNSSLLSRNFFM